MNEIRKSHGFKAGGMIKADEAAHLLSKIDAGGVSCGPHWCNEIPGKEGTWP